MSIDKLSYLHELRKEEFLSFLVVVRQYPKIRDVLEIGSGSGYQLGLLKEKFSNVFGIDVPYSNYKDSHTNDVLMYDGLKFPFSDNNFDLIFSSHCLEHISALDEILAEKRRVLRENGICVHIMPTHSWRFFTNLSFYFRKIKLKRESSIAKFNNFDLKLRSQSLLLERIFPERHGERGNFITEIFYFHPFWWKKKFRNAGWHVVDDFPVRIFYTGDSLFGFRLNMRFRKCISFFLGSSSHIYILKC